MSKLSPPPALAAVLLCLLLAAPADTRAQERNAPKLEVGAHFTALELNPPEFFGGTTTEAGVGGRFAYNATDYLGLEAEVNFLPQRSPLGRVTQGQFGVKVGKRFRKFGVFAKARPGFVSFSEVLTVVGVTEIRPPNGPGITEILFDFKRQTHFSADLGGVVEFYPSRRLLMRVDAGDTVIRFDRDPLPPAFGAGTGFPSGVAHNFQLSAGVAYRFRDPEGADDADPPAPDDADGTPRFEAGVQYTSLFVNRPTQFFPFLIAGGGRTTFPEPAVGGRLAVNLNDNFAVEGAVDFLTREQGARPEAGGFGVQGQFGVKAGRRFERFGLFAKARPGFLTYSRAILLTSERTEFNEILRRPVTVGTFELGRKTHFEADFGGVVEFYPTRRVVTRFDLGDTVIRYGERATPGATLSQQIVRLAAETRHNFQFSAGLGLRF